MKRDITEEQLQKQEEQIPKLAQEAFQKAYQAAIATGQTVTVVRGNIIVEVNNRGTVKEIGRVKPDRKVKPGQKGFRIR